MFDALTTFYAGATARLLTLRDKGQGMTEYALLLVLIVAVVIGVATLFGADLVKEFTNAINSIFGSSS